MLNKHLSKCMPGLTAKVFRTYNASYTFQEELKKTPEDATVAEKLLAYNRANREVAILCNHQRAAPKTHGNQMIKLKDKVLGYKYERQLIKEQMIELEPPLKKKRPELTEPESEVDDEFIERYLQMQKEKEEQAAQKKLVKENEKRKEQGLEPLTELPDVSSRVKKPITDMTRLEKKYEQLSDRILAAKTNMIDKVSFYVNFLKRKPNTTQFRMKTKRRLWELPKSITSIPVSLHLGVKNMMFLLKRFSQRH